LSIFVVEHFGLQEIGRPAFLMMEGEVRSDRERDAEMDRLLRAVMAGEPSAAAGACPSADDLAAYAERTLGDGERETMDTHLAACRDCQETLALLAAMPESSATGPAAMPAPSWWRAGWKRWLVPLGAAATGVLLYVAIKPDSSLQQVVPARESVVASAPAELPAPPQPARVEGTSAVERKDTPASKGRGGAPAPRVEEPSQPVDVQARKKDVTGAGPQVPKARPTSIETLPEPVTPPARARDVAAPVPTLVGAAMPAAPPPPPPPAQSPTLAKAEAKEQVRALPVVGGVAGADAAAKQGIEAPAAGRALKPVTENLAVTGEAPVIQYSAAPVVVNAANDAKTQWSLRGPRILRSDDGGQSWREQHAGRVVLLAGSSSSITTCWVVGAAGLVLRTTDGQAWAPRPFPERVDLTAVTATDVLHATVTARDGRRFTTGDGGETWTPVR
jgi:hypothetical protein